MNSVLVHAHAHGSSHFRFIQLNVNVFGHLYLMLNNPFRILSHESDKRKKSHFERLNEKCPKMHLIEMNVIIYRTNDVYIIRKSVNSFMSKWMMTPAEHTKMPPLKLTAWRVLSRSWSMTIMDQWSLIKNSYHEHKRPLVLIQFFYCLEILTIISHHSHFFLQNVIVYYIFSCLFMSIPNIM